MGPGTGVETAVARLACLPEDGRVDRQQGELEIPGTPMARCRKSVEGREKNGEAGGELWMATAAWRGKSWALRLG